MTPASLRVVIVLPIYIPEGFGGAEQQTRQLAHALARRGVAVTLLAPRLEGKSPAQEQDGPVVVRRFLLRAAPNLGGRHMDAFLCWCLCVSTWLWRNRRAYDVIHVIHGRLHAFPAAVSGRWLGKPVLVKVGNGGEGYFDLTVVQRKRLLGSFFARAVARSATAWVATSRQIAADLASWGVLSERVHPIPNGVAIPDSVVPRARDGGVRLLSVGRLAPEKAVDQTIRAFAALESDKVTCLTIIGDGPCRQELESLSRSLGQDSRITFTGAVAEVAPYLRQADIYVSSSVSEGMSNALLEAMSYGAVPVVSRASGVDDVVADGVSGLLFSSGDEVQLAQRLEEALSMTEERRSAMSDAARTTARDHFSLDAVAERHVALYRRLVEQDGTVRDGRTQKSGTRFDRS